MHFRDLVSCWIDLSMDGTAWRMAASTESASETLLEVNESSKGT